MGIRKLHYYMAFRLPTYPPTPVNPFVHSRPLDRAVWWLEFLIRHPGKNHMRSPVHDLAW